MMQIVHLTINIQHAIFLENLRLRSVMNWWSHLITQWNCSNFIILSMLYCNQYIWWLEYPSWGRWGFPHSLLAFGYFFSRASGRVVSPYPFLTSCSWISLSLCKWEIRDSFILSGRTVVGSPSPLHQCMKPWFDPMISWVDVRHNY